MKKVSFILLTIILTIQFTMCMAIDYDVVDKVTITGLDSPYRYVGTLDTDVVLSKDTKAAVNRVSWSQNAQGVYVATIRLRPAMYTQMFADTVSITVNGNMIDSYYVDEDGYLVLTYTYPDTSSSTSVNSSVMTHVITVYYASNGQILPKTIRAPHGKDFKVQIIPNEGYEVKDVEVDGISVGAVEEYTFKKVKETHKIRASFKPIEGYEKVEEPIEFDREKVKWAADLVRDLLLELASIK